MKTTVQILVSALVMLFMLTPNQNTFAQTKPSLGIVSIDAKGLAYDNLTMASLLRVEVEKLGQFEVLDKYDVRDALNNNGIDAETCLGKSQVVRAGKVLSASRMLTGSVEKFGNKILIHLHLINVSTAVIEKATIREFVNQEEDIQIMVRIALNQLLDLPNDQHLLDLLSNFESPIVSNKTMLKLNGPRMGLAFVDGETMKRLAAPRSDGGYDMFPVTSMFGYQWEKQYISSGDFQALFEVFAAITGLESGRIMPSIVFMNGFRFNDSGLEFGLGPVLRIVKASKGYWDGDTWNKTDVHPEGKPLEQAIDNRGEMALSPGLIIAVGKTFRSGYLNIPINAYYSPKKSGSTYGLTFGFNIAKAPAKVK